MKKLLFSALLLPTLALAQTTKPDQYCILRLGLERADGRASMALLAGSGELAASQQQVEDAAKVEAMKYEADALNYLSNRGWEVVGLSFTPAWGTRYCLRRHKP